jgi:Tubulin like
MLDRFLVVGLGGSGGRTVRNLRAELNRRLFAAGYRDGLPAGWNFLHVDVPKLCDIEDAGVDTDLPYLGLATEGVSYRQIDGLVNGRSKAAKSYASGWRPNPNLAVEPTLGAGQMRAVGRMVATAGVTKLAAGLRRALADVGSADPTELSAVSSAVQSEKAGGTTWVIVISSLSGGAGAGMFLDVCDAFRMLDPAVSPHLIGLLYAPDIFPDVKGASAQGIMPNALAAYAELLASYWNGEAPEANEFALLETPELLVTRGQTRRGPSYPFIISRTNGQVTLKTQHEVFGLTAAALATLMLSDRLQQNFSESLTGNWPSAGHRPDSSGLTRSDDDLQPISSLGYASLSIGRERFTTYAAQRFAGLLGMRVLEGHRQQADENISDAEILPSVVAQNLELFLANCGLREKGPDDNDVLDALRGGPDATWRDKLSAEVELVLGTVTKGKTTLDRDGAQAALTNTINARRVSFLAENKVSIDTNAEGWVTDVQGHILAAVCQSLVNSGGRGTVALLEAASRYLTDEVAPELRTDAASWERAAGTSAGDLVAGILQKAAKKIQTTSGDLRQAAQGGVRKWRNMGEVQLHLLAAELVQNLAKEFLDPLRRTIDDAVDQLQEETDGLVGNPSPLRRWAAGAVPDELLPTEYETLLEDPKTWPSIYETLMKSQTGISFAETAQQAALGVAVKNSNPLVTRQPWSPPFTVLSTSSSAAQGKFLLDLRLPMLLQISYSWLETADSSFARHASERLQDWLTTSEDGRSAASRKRDFLAGLEHTLNVARPLIDLENAALARIHGDAEIANDFERFLTPFPLESTAEIATEVKKVLSSAGFDDTQQAGAFDPASNQTTFGLLTVPRGPVSPLVVNSIAEPLAADASARADWSNYWQARRSRPLLQAMPAPLAFRHAVISGWFVARLLGCVDLELVASPKVLFDGHWLGFGQFLGGPPTKPQHVLGSLLESFPLALVRAVRADEKALAPYQALASYGMPTSDGENALPGVVEEWLKSGVLPRGGRGAILSAETTADGMDARRAVLGGILDQAQKDYSEIAEDEFVHFGDDHVRRQWEISKAALLIVDQLRWALSAFGTTKPSPTL